MTREEDVDASVLAARALFPRGLSQLAGGFRFGADTLLLAAFAAGQLKAGRAHAGLELGAGCGAASFGLMLLRGEDDIRVTGLDLDPEMVARGRENAVSLGLDGRYVPLQADVSDYRGPACGFVLANPPFRRPGSGRACPDPAKDRARFEGPGGFAAFAACAARHLRPRGLFFLVHLSERLPGIFAELGAAGLVPRILLPVQGGAGRPPRLSLIMAVRGGGEGLSLLPPLALYGPDGTLTPEAGAFCPHLGANPRRSRSGM